MKKSGITLVELVVVAGVVVLAAALFLPALAGVSVKDDLTTCLRRSLNLSTAILQYTADYDGILPPGKRGDQGGNPVSHIWSELLYELDYVETKEEFQCPADDVTNNSNRYYDAGPAYPDYWSSYCLPMNLCDLFWIDHTPRAAVLANHEGMLDKQVLLGESEVNYINARWFGRGDAYSFRLTYTQQFPLDRHEGFCTYVMLDGHAKAMRVPSSDAVDTAQFGSEIRAQFETCDVERDGSRGGDLLPPHPCFWNRYKRGLEASNPYDN